MAEGRMSHNWDLFAPLLCYVANPWIENKRNRLTVEKVHPFFEREPEKEKPFDKGNWNLLKDRLKGRSKRKKPPK